MGYSVISHNKRYWYCQERDAIEKAEIVSKAVPKVIVVEDDTDEIIMSTKTTWTKDSLRIVFNHRGDIWTYHVSGKVNESADLKRNQTYYINVKDIISISGKQFISPHSHTVVVESRCLVKALSQISKDYAVISCTCEVE